uniref:Putative secreted protein n=1 Tax=Anopheles triannulatus TaxID=58253 RepID=A0A2M3ZXS9_9DIPT
MKYLGVLLFLGVMAYASVAGAPVPQESKEETTTAKGEATTAKGETTDAPKAEKPANGGPTEFLQNIIHNAMNSLPPNLKDRLQVIGLNF